MDHGTDEVGYDSSAEMGDELETQMAAEVEEEDSKSKKKAKKVQTIE